MKTRTVIAILLATAGLAAYAQEPTPKASLQICNDVVQDYDAAVRGGNVEAIADARSRVLKECYSGSGRTPILQEPISIGADHQAAAPVKAAPAAPTKVTPNAPGVLTLCDSGGCWDNLGNRYNGTGATLMGPTGKLCVRTGDNWIECH
jgi:hypothetical protein